MQPNLEDMESRLQSMNAPQSMSGNQPDPTMSQAPWMDGNDQEDDVEGAVVANMDDLSEEDKMYVDNYLSDEVAKVIAKIGGDDRIYAALQPYINQDLFLVPVPRSEFSAMMNSPTDPTGQAPTPEAAQPAQPEAQSPNQPVNQQLATL